MSKTKENYTDKLFFKIKNNKLIAYIIVFVAIVSGIIGFWNLIKPLCTTTEKKSDVIEKIELVESKEYETFDYILEQYHPDTLRANKFIRSIVARRDFEMYFLIPTNWDIEEPLDGPAGLRFKAYYLPSNAQNTIKAIANIVCIDDLIDLTDSMDFYVGEGCTIDEYVNYRIESARQNSTKFHLFTTSPAFKYFVESPEVRYLIEAKRIKYSFELEGEMVIVMELIAYLNKVGFILQYSAPEKDYYKHENTFIKITNNVYYKQM